MSLDKDAKAPSWLDYIGEVSHANRFAIQPEHGSDVQGQLYQAAEAAEAAGDDPRAAIRKRMLECLNEYGAEHDATHNRHGQDDDAIDWE